MNVNIYTYNDIHKLRSPRVWSLSRPWKKFWPWRIGNKSDNATDSTPRIHTVARLGLIKEGVCFRFFGCLQDEGRNCSKCCTVMTGFTPLKIQNPRSCSSAVILPPWTTFWRSHFPCCQQPQQKSSRGFSEYSKPPDDHPGFDNEAGTTKAGKSSTSILQTASKACSTACCSHCQPLQQPLSSHLHSQLLHVKNFYL